MMEILTTRDILNHLRCGKSTLWRLLNSGEIPSFRVGRRRLVLKKDFEAFLLRIVEEQSRREERTP